MLERQRWSNSFVITEIFHKTFINSLSMRNKTMIFRALIPGSKRRSHDQRPWVYVKDFWPEGNIGVAGIMKGYVVALAPKQFPFIPAADVLFLRDTIFCFHSSFSLVWITNPCQPTRRKENKSKIVSSRKSIGVRHAKRRSARTYQRLQTISSSIFFGNRLSLVNRWALLGGTGRTLEN